MIDKRSIVPIYEQIINQCKALIACEVIKTGDQLESVRSLSSRLGINPNTIQKAYTELENQFICNSVPGKGRFVTADAKNIIKDTAASNTATLEREVSKLALSGLTLEEILSIVRLAHLSADKKINAIKSQSRKDLSND